MTPMERSVRALRSLALAALVLALSGLGHLLGGGAAAPVPLALLAVAATPLFWWAADRRWTLRALLVGLGGMQVAIHALLVLAATPSTADTRSRAGTHLVHGTHLDLAPAGGAHAASGHLTLTMLGGHVLATLAAALLLAHGEALLARLGRWLEALLPDARTLPRLPGRARDGLLAPVRLHRPGRLVGAHPGRGPPSALC